MAECWFPVSVVFLASFLSLGCGRGRNNFVLARLWPRWGSFLSVVAEKEKLPYREVLLKKQNFRCAAVLFYTRLFLGGGREKFRTFCLRWCQSSFMVVVLFVFGLA